MLVLTRSAGERLVIGDNAEITLSILEIRGNQVRIGINAPRNVAVHREEIYKRIQAEGCHRDEAHKAEIEMEETDKSEEKAQLEETV